MSYFLLMIIMMYYYRMMPCRIGKVIFIYTTKSSGSPAQWRSDIKNRTIKLLFVFVAASNHLLHAALLVPVRCVVYALLYDGSDLTLEIMKTL
jgi:hypothetical protein